MRSRNLTGHSKATNRFADIVTIKYATAEVWHGSFSWCIVISMIICISYHSDIEVYLLELVLFITDQTCHPVSLYFKILNKHITIEDLWKKCLPKYKVFNNYTLNLDIDIKVFKKLKQMLKE